MNPDRLESLLLAYEENALTAEELAELKTHLATSPEARRRLVEVQMLQQAISTHEFVVEKKVPLIQTSPRSSWRSFIAPAAAGLVIGCLCTSMLWALSGPVFSDGLKRYLLPLANPGFEQQETLPQVHLVPQAGQWSGMDTEIVSAGGAKPEARSGKRMIRLGPAPEGKGYFANVMADLTTSRPAGDAPLQIEVTAHYHASIPEQGEHYSLNVATFAESAETVSGHWENTWRDMRDASLTNTGKAIFPTAKDSGWQSITVLLDVPPQARTLVISMGSNTPGPVAGRTDHFMDDVQASWIIRPQTPTP